MYLIQKYIKEIFYMFSYTVSLKLGEDFIGKQNSF